MLLCELKHIQHGLYVGIAAYPQDNDSTAKAYYGCLCNGVNFENIPQDSAELLKARDRNINIFVLVTDTEGLVKICLASKTGLKAVAINVAKRHKSSDWVREALAVPTRTLTQILADHVATEQTLTFVKIGAKDHEASVLRGLDLLRYMPSIILIEGTSPFVNRNSHRAWGHLVVQCGYLFAYRNGLNRLYVAQDRAELLPPFHIRTNIFDDCQSATQPNAIDFSKQTKAAAIGLANCISGMLKIIRRAEVIGLTEKRVYNELNKSKPNGLQKYLLFHKSSSPRRIIKLILSGQSAKMYTVDQSKKRFFLDRPTEIIKRKETVNLRRRIEQQIDFLLNQVYGEKNALKT